MLAITYVANRPNSRNFDPATLAPITTTQHRILYYFVDCVATAESSSIEVHAILRFTSKGSNKPTISMRALKFWIHVAADC
jgi:hypothetical protein